MKHTDEWVWTHTQPPLTGNSGDAKLLLKSPPPPEILDPPI